MSVESYAYLCYNIKFYVTLSILMYSIAHKYPRILMLQVNYYMARSYYIGFTSQKLRKRLRSLDFDSSHVGLLFIARFKILALIVYNEF